MAIQLNYPYPLRKNQDHKGNYLGVVIFLSDITEQVRMEEMMIQSEKMVSVGGLAAGHGPRKSIIR